MSPRLLAPLVLTAVLAFACGPRSHSSGPTSRKPTSSSVEVASSLDVRLEKGVTFAFHVTNSAPKRLELTFPSGQTHDLVVLDEMGREIWRWSDGRMFTQTLQNQVLERDETVSYRAEWEPQTLHGRFVAVASLRSENHPLEQRVHFSLP